MPTSPVQLNPGLPPQLEPILNKALEKDRELRCQTAAELRADLKRLKRDTDSSRAGVSAASAAPVVAERHDPTPSPKRGYKLTAALVGVALLIGAGAGLLAGKPFWRLAIPNPRYHGLHSGAATSVRAIRLGWADHSVQRSVAGQSGRDLQRPSWRRGVPFSWTRAYPLLSVSPAGEMAVALNTHRTGTWVNVGTLASAPLAGGAPREIWRTYSGRLVAGRQQPRRWCAT